MAALMQEVCDRALKLRVPINVQFDLTYRCNERCVHCYLDHEDYGEMTTAEVKNVLDQLAAAGTFFLILSGGELLLRKDFFEILEYAQALHFDVKLKTNGILIREREADRIRELGVRQVQISIYSHRPEVHDGITKVRGSLERSLAAIRLLRSRGLKVLIANVLMRRNWEDYPHVQQLARDLGVEFTLDPTITPKMDGDTAILGLRSPSHSLQRIFRDPSLVGNVEEVCAPPALGGEDVMEGIPCSAGHTACYISPYGDVYPCVQFPLPCGSLRQQPFSEIWRGSRQFQEVRSIRVRDLPVCSGCVHVGSCTRCPGLAYMEGNMRGPSSADCEKSFARTGVPSANMVNNFSSAPALVQIQGVEGGMAR